ncbi:SRPBCC family protein [Nocardia sp. NPDC052278]|uniref:SRPBCC family protein n=1 Tax=unclassified Nocardia TaxID=2637762 RepID=UPI0036B5205D
MAVDVSTEAVIECPRAQVAAFAGDPTNAPRWYANIDRIEWQTEPPLRIGSRMEFVARFLGRQLVYTYEVVEYTPGERLVMRTVEGPFPMETTYAWADAGPDRTRMILRNTGTPSGFGKLAAPIMEAAMRRANRADLARLAALLEA